MVPALAELDAELPLFRAVQEWAAARIEADAVAAEVASRLPHVTVVDYRLTNAENTLWLQAALHAAEHRGEKAEIARAAGNLGLVHRERGELEEALAMHSKSLAIAEELGNRAGMARRFSSIGFVLKDQGDWQGAADHFRRSLALAEELGMPDVEARRRALAEAEAHLARKENADGGPG